MRRVGKCALAANLRNGFRGRDQQHSGVHEPLTDKPLVGRHEKYPFELFLEGGERSVAECSQFVDRNIVEDVVVHQLLEILLRRVDVPENFAAQTALVVRNDQIDQFGHLDVFRRFVV